MPGVAVEVQGLDPVARAEEQRVRALQTIHWIVCLAYGQPLLTPAGTVRRPGQTPARGNDKAPSPSATRGLCSGKAG